MDDLVGVLVATATAGRVVIIERRKAAVKIIQDMIYAPRSIHLLHDIVGNPIAIDLTDVRAVMLIPVSEEGAKLVAALAPVEPSIDLVALVPETLVKSERPGGAKPVSAADEDPIEQFSSSWGRK